MQLDDAGEGRQAIAALTTCLNQETLLDLAARFSDVYKQFAKTSLEHFLVTPVTVLPTGKEKGKFVSIDVGGSNLRVGFVELLGEVENGAENGLDPSSEKIKRSYDKSWPIGEHLKMDKAEDLFRWIGDCIAEVITDALEDIPASIDAPFGEELLLGITFSFPMAQRTLSEATLLPMGKGFAITSDLDLGKMLRDGYSHHLHNSNADDRAGESEEGSCGEKTSPSRLPRIRVAAITNDTVATFASSAYTVKAAPNSRVAMGLIVGTGTNATVPMRLSDLHPRKRDDLANPETVETVVVNTEWTIRGTDKPLVDLQIKTVWDESLDASSDAPGFQPFEYMTSGRYLGEIVRLVFVDVVSKRPGVQIPLSLRNKNALQTKFLSEVVARMDDETLRRELESLYPSSASMSFWTPMRVKLVREIAYAVQQRSSALIAAACVGLLDCVHDIQVNSDKSSGHATIQNTESEELVIAYTGSTISHYPEWLITCQRWIDTLVASGCPANESKRVVLREAVDGGIVGAGVLVGTTQRID